MALDEKRHNILVCGGGNGAHTLASIASLRPNADVNVLTLYADESERWTDLLNKNPMKLILTYKEGNVGEFQARPKVVTKDPAAVVPYAEFIFFVVPAFAHEQYLKEISKHIRENTVIVGLPAQAGFEFQCLSILGHEKAKKCAIVSFETLPWACRIIEFGQIVKVLGIKDSIGAALLQGSECTPSHPVYEMIQWVLGERPVVTPIKNYIAISLMADAIIHPPIMYGKWSRWDGTPLDEKPLFYQGVDEFTADIITKVSDEVLAAAKEIERGREGVDMKDVVPLLEWYRIHYSDQIVDDSNLMRALQTNRAYDGLIHPMKQTDDGKYVPDFTYRYTKEDVPFGFVVMKGIAEIVGIKTPVMDEVLTWAQGKLGKEFIVGSELKGKDISSSRAPQSFGFKTIDELLNV